MSLVSLKSILEPGVDKYYAVGAFNVTNHLLFESVLKAAESKNKPVIISIAEVHFKYLDLDNFIPYIKDRINLSQVPVVLHLDHGLSFETVMKAIHWGFSSVMIDASSLSLEENIKLTKKVVEAAHSADVSVEAELGHVAGGEGDIKNGTEVDKNTYTKVEDANYFVQETGIDALAVAVGTVHGLYKGKPDLDLKRLAKIRDELEIPLVLLDIRMPEMDGITTLKKIKELKPALNIIIITGFGSIETAVEAMKNGAIDFVKKPFNLNQLLDKINTALKVKYLIIKDQQPSQRSGERYTFQQIIGKSNKMQQIYQMIEKIADKNVTVLITGESGVGKELVARAIHNTSPRNNKPFIKVNCAALPQQLLESELFGHEKGSFTGAVKQKKGMFELADQGTILLDEIGDMSLVTQAKILRVLQEHKFQRVGGEKTIEVDVRIIASTNVNLQEAINSNKFREDLYYRLNVVRLNISSLKNRREDIPLLTNSFIKEYNKKHNKNIKGVTPGAMRLLMTYDWPGNVRELRNVCEQAVVLTDDTIITSDDLPGEIRDSAFTFEDSNNQSLKDITKNLTSEIEKKIIEETLEENEGNRNSTAAQLGITVRTLYNKIKEYNIKG
jgi:two-component system response regulator AtoC